MEVGLSSASFYPKVNTENAISLMKMLGFNKGEIFLNSPSEYEDDFINNLSEQKYKYNFIIKSIHSFASYFEPFLFDDYKRRRDDMFEIYKKVCKAASNLGAEYYTFHGMRLIDADNLDMSKIMDIYSKLAYYAAENGIKLCQENVSWCMSSRIDFIYKLKNYCKYPVYFTLDLKQAYKAGVLPKEYIKVMDERLLNLHINDKDDQNACLLPGRGSINYYELINNLKSINYKGIAIIEVYGDNYNEYNELTESAQFLNKCIQKLNF